MKKLVYIAMTLVSMLFINKKTFGNDAVVSANGFACSTEGRLVWCTGSFPNHLEPTVSVSGFYSVFIVATFHDFRWIYDSETGCLCRRSHDGKDGEMGAGLCTSRTGIEKTFSSNSIHDKVDQTWCKNH